MTSLSDAYLQALHFAAAAHGKQKTLAGHPYVVHLSCVAMELAQVLRAEPGRDEALAISCALLHDVVEDTSIELAEVERVFGPRVAQGVSALTKNAALPKEAQMRDSLDRILQQPPEIAMVKLADRITNTASVPSQWSTEKVAAYRTEAALILNALGGASAVLSDRLRSRISAYGA